MATPRTHYPCSLTVSMVCLFLAMFVNLGSGQCPNRDLACLQSIDNEFSVRFIPFLPQSRQLSVFVEILFETSALRINSCCTKYTYRPTLYKPDPLADDTVKAAFVRTDSSRIVQFIGTNRGVNNLRGRLHTLAMVDTDVSGEFGSALRPVVHWLAVNIRDGNFSTAQEVLGYFGPAPGPPRPHTYYFLLFEQVRPASLENRDYSFGNCSSFIPGRCGYDMSAFINENALQLVGATWMTIKNDEFVRYSYTSLGLPQEQVCAGVPEFTSPCPDDDSDSEDDSDSISESQDDSDSEDDSDSHDDSSSDEDSGSDESSEEDDGWAATLAGCFTKLFKWGY